MSGLPGGRWHPDWSGFRPLAADVGQLAFSLTLALSSPSPRLRRAGRGEREKSSLTPASPSFAKASSFVKTTEDKSGGIPEGEGKWAQQIYPPQEGSAARHNAAGKRAGSWKVRESS